MRLTFVALAVATTLASSASASFLWGKQKTSTPGPNIGMRQPTQATSFTGRVRQATLHIAALDDPIYQDMRLCWDQLRTVQWFINIYLPRIEEDDRETAYANINHKLDAVTQLVQKIAIENKLTKDPFLKVLIESQLLAFYAKYNLVKLNFSVVSFLTNLARHHIPAFKQGVRKYGGKAVTGVKTVGEKTVEGTQFVGGKALTGARVVHRHVSKAVKTIYAKIQEWSEAIRTKGANVLEKWAGLDQDDYDEFVDETDGHYYGIQREEEGFEFKAHHLDSQNK